MIELKNIKKGFDGNIIFEDFSMTIDVGSFVVFAGPSGCGKTTLLNMIGGLEKPDEGIVSVDGVDIYQLKRKHDFFTYKVGFLFQNFALVENKTVRKNLEFVQRKSRTESSIEDILETVGMPDKIDTEVYKLSGGEQQRVAIARLMFKKCEIILADEPTGSLDAQNEQAVLGLLHQLNGQGKTIILVTHNEKIIEAEKEVVNL